jgi:hypothetical protein
MPFTKLGNDRYKSPSGKIMTGAQVRAYHAKEGENKRPKRNQRTNTNRKKKNK